MVQGSAFDAAAADADSDAESDAETDADTKPATRAYSSSYCALTKRRPKKTTDDTLRASCVRECASEFDDKKISAAELRLIVAGFLEPTADDWQRGALRRKRMRTMYSGPVSASRAAARI